MKDYKSESNQEKNATKIQKLTPVHFFLGFLLISFIIAFVIGGVILGKDKENKQSSATDVKEQIKISAEDIPGNPEEWETYQIQEAGVELKLPEKITNNGTWKTYKINGNNGTLICFSKEKPDENNAACSKDDFLITATSPDFNKNGNPQFQDFQSFENRNNTYFVKTADGKEFSLENITSNEFAGENKLKILKILGKNSTTGTPDEGYLGAVIITNNPSFPGLTISMSLNGDLSELEFDQILENIKIIN